MDTHQFTIHLHSVHGLIRGENIELGRNADTGGQVKYLIEFAKALGTRPDVKRVNIFTRLIDDKTLSSDYAQPIEHVAENVRIIRIQCGGRKYIRKELLWPHLDEFVDKTLKFVKDHDLIPDVVHGHYADAGYIARELSAFWGVPCIFTGHSLGRVKKLDLEESGMGTEEMQKKFRIGRRIAVEEEILSNADLVIASTTQEIREQYGLYQSGSIARFCVIPPGIDITRFYPFYDNWLQEEVELHEREQAKQAQFYVRKELDRFLMYPEKPLILALSRPDRRKNISGLISAYGQDKELQAIANLAVFAGIRKDISDMDTNEQEVLTELLLLMDKFDLYGKLAIPKRHDVEYEVPELYRLIAQKQGVFVNPAFKENFGLTLIEAAATGLPVVATNTGGPHDIVENCQNGLLVDVNNPQEMTQAIKTILVDQEFWKTCSQNGIAGVREHYTWEAHTQKYLEQLRQLTGQTHPTRTDFTPPKAIGKKFSHVQKFFFSDIDDTLIGDDEALVRLMNVLNTHHEQVGFGMVTGRPLPSVQDVLVEYNISMPDMIISSVGTEIYYGADLLPDKGWVSHISVGWEPEKIKTILNAIPFLHLQEQEAQREFKISYFMEPGEEQITKIHQVLTEQRLRYTLIYSREMFLDILPYRASKGKAIRYLSYKWNIPLGNIVVAGDSENDEDMLRGEMLGIIVGNHHEELDKLQGLRHIYFASAHYAAGILEGFEHYRFPFSEAWAST